MDVDPRGTERQHVEPLLIHLQTVLIFTGKKKILLTLQHGFESHALSIISSQRPLGCVQRSKLMVTDMPYKAAADTGHKELQCLLENFTPPCLALLRC